MKQWLSADAITRYGNVKAAHPEQAIRILTVMAQLVENGQIRRQVSDDEFKSILQAMQSSKKEMKVKFK